MPEYIPTFDAHEVEIRKKRQEDVYESFKQLTKPVKFILFDFKITVLPGMFPTRWEDTTLLAKQVLAEVKETDSVLDLGCGTGIQGLCAGTKAKHIVMSEINPVALECAKINVKNNGQIGKVQFIQSDLFENIPQKFDLIIFNPPFRWGN